MIKFLFNYNGSILSVILHDGSLDVSQIMSSYFQGLWRDNLWGYSPHSAPPGGGFLVWFGGKLSDIDERWINVRNSISGGSLP